MKRFSYISLITLLMVPVLMFSSVILSAPVASAADPATPPVATENASLAALQTTLEQIYTKVSPSVVNIQVVLQQSANSSPFGNIPGFPFLGPNGQQGQQGQQQYAEALGSGFVWDMQGDIVTNNHVVDGATRITVTFPDGTAVPGKVIGTDPSSDLAVVKVNVPAGELHPVVVADSNQVQVGQLNVAIGNPFGLKGTMTVGFVSALGRLLPTGSNAQQQQGPTYSIPDIIQTDAPINPGNSGGVLLNDQGELIGVTSAIVSAARSSSGVGFAIPSDIVKQEIPVLIKTGTFSHPWLGISGTSLTPELDTAMKLKSGQQGALVVDVTSGSPADKAGVMGSSSQVDILGQQALIGGDVIVALNGQPVKSFDDLVTNLATMQVGQKATLTVLRNGQQKSIQVTLTARPQQPPQASGDPSNQFADQTV